MEGKSREEKLHTALFERRGGERRPQFQSFRVENLGIYVCIVAYSSRADKQICTKLGVLIPRDQEENMSKLQRMCPEFETR
jgi:hypothetical protein